MSQQLQVYNPYWNEVQPLLEKHIVSIPTGLSFFSQYVDFKKLGIHLGELMCQRFEALDRLVPKYSYAITHPKLLDIIDDFSEGKIIEFGAGKGYWAHMLSKRGNQVVAIDGYRWPSPWYPVLNGDVSHVSLFPDHTLLLCWPDMGEVAYEVLMAYKGKRVIYIGEYGGCTGGADFHNLLETQWYCEIQAYNASFISIKDAIYCYTRKATYDVRSSTT